jgi:hypothetical protein
MDDHVESLPYRSQVCGQRHELMPLDFGVADHAGLHYGSTRDDGIEYGL